MSENLLTTTSLAQRFDAARERERRARREVRRLQRELAVRDKRLESQRKFLIGYAILQAAKTCNEPTLAALRRMVHAYVTRPSDLEALSGTPFSAEPDCARATPDAARGG